MSRLRPTREAPSECATVAQSCRPEMPTQNHFRNVLFPYETEHTNCHKSNAALPVRLRGITFVTFYPKTCIVIPNLITQQSILSTTQQLTQQSPLWQSKAIMRQNDHISMFLPLLRQISLHLIVELHHRASDFQCDTSNKVFPSLNASKSP